MAHFLFSTDTEIMIMSFDKFDKELIKEEIVKHLKQFPDDEVQHCKDYSAKELKKYYGHKIINIYAVNKRNNKVSKLLDKGGKTCYTSIED